MFKKWWTWLRGRFQKYTWWEYTFRRVGYPVQLLRGDTVQLSNGRKWTAKETTLFQNEQEARACMEKRGEDD